MLRRQKLGDGIKLPGEWTEQGHPDMFREHPISLLKIQRQYNEDAGAGHILDKENSKKSLQHEVKKEGDCTD